MNKCGHCGREAFEFPVRISTPYGVYYACGRVCGIGLFQSGTLEGL